MTTVLLSEVNATGRVLVEDVTRDCVLVGVSKAVVTRRAARLEGGTSAGESEAPHPARCRPRVLRHRGPRLLLLQFTFELPKKDTQLRKYAGISIHGGCMCAIPYPDNSLPWQFPIVYMDLYWSWWVVLLVDIGLVGNCPQWWVVLLEPLYPLKIASSPPPHPRQVNPLEEKNTTVLTSSPSFWSSFQISQSHRSDGSILFYLLQCIIGKQIWICTCNCWRLCTKVVIQNISLQNGGSGGIMDVIPSNRSHQSIYW